MSDDDAVLAANRAFYRAFATRDLAAMEALWAEHAPVACIHPGWDALIGRAAVLASWRGILAHETPITCRAERVLRLGDSACVICHETVDGGVLIATNVFVREADGWRLVHHQAGGVAAEALAPPSPPEETPQGTPPTATRH
jgi:ketosteroid isomerase-like protein